MPRPLKVFLCHASQDKPAVRKMYFYLKQHGVQTWLDREDLLPGQDWEVEIPKAIFTSDVILVCLSKNSVNKEGYVQKEIAFALDKALEKPEGTIFIIPVKLEECDVPSRLKRYQWVDYFRMDGRKRLLMGLNMRAQGLGEEIAPVIMEDSKPKTPRPQSPRADIKQEKPAREGPMKEILAEILPDFPTKQSESKPVKRKPFTKILDPSSLASSKPRPVENTPTPKQNYRWIGIAGIVLLLSVFSGIGLNSLFNQPLVTTTTPTEDIAQTPILPTKTSVSITSTFEPTETIVPTPTLGIGSTMVSEKDGMVMVYVPAGVFMMGSDIVSYTQPIHQVYLSAFWIDQTEVTNKMYSMCVNIGECDPPSNTGHYDLIDFASHPVIYVDWDKAKTYCEWASRRLPTEAEWEKAARGTGGRTYPWGENIDCSYANYWSSSGHGCIGGTTEVGSYPSGTSRYGALDMAGNVWEWVTDWYDANYYQSLPTLNPQGPESGTYKVIRGGSWVDRAFYSCSGLESSDRCSREPMNSSNNLGFRCTLSQP